MCYIILKEEKSILLVYDMMYFVYMQFLSVNDSCAK